MRIKVEELRRVRLDEGEVLMVQTPERMPQEAVQRTVEQLEEVFPDNQVLVVPGGFQVRAVKP